METTPRQFDMTQAKAAFAQLVRFVIAGGLATLCYAAVYSPLAATKLTSEQVANICGYLVAMLVGYLLHSSWSFRGHGASTTKTGPRFLAVSVFSFVANTFWVWLLTDDAAMAGPWWWPLIPILFVTPLVTFSLNRLWVFK